MAAGGQDEEWYAVPGLTIAREGIPRVPYSRAEDPESVFYGADQILYAQPPLSFYAQAPFFALLPGTYGTARLASFLAACISILLVFGIGRSLFGDSHVGLLAAALYSGSRLCFFPALVARPDMLCGTLGLGSVYCLCLWRQRPAWGWLLIAGVAVGLAGLSHPFAIVFAMQLGVWIAVMQGTFVERARRLVVFGTGVAAAFSLWIPLILLRPELFQAQFIGNILRPAGPGLISRLLMPAESFAHQIPPLIDRTHPVAFGMLAAGLLFMGWLAFNRRQQEIVVGWLLAISSIYLLVACLGDHPIQGFWCYSAGLSWLCCAYGFLYICKRLPSRWRPAGTLLGVIVLAAGLLPGSGARTVLTYATHWRDPVYHAPRFIRGVLAELPADATVTVGPEFALDAYAEGRQVILACRHPLYYDSSLYPTDYYIFGRRDFAEDMPSHYRCERINTYGSLENVFSNYAEVYRSTEW